MLGELIQSLESVDLHPNCPKCGTKMVLARIARIQVEKSEQDRLTFECPRCARTEMEIVKVH